MERCIISGKVIQIEIIEWYCNDVNIIINSLEWKYHIKSFQPTFLWWCQFNGYAIYWNYFELWETVDILVDKNSYKLISHWKASVWEYKIANWSYTSTWNFEVCEPNMWEDTEIQAKFRNIHTYLGELSYSRPRTAKKLFLALEDLDLSIFPQETNILVLYAREILKMLVESL
jgi:hypothetical protein